jgi:hypothetical protein
MIPPPPKAYKNAGIAIMVSGLINAVFAFGWASALFCVACLGSLWLIPFGLAIFEAVTGYTMMEGQPRPNAKLTAIIGLCVSAFLLNPFSLAGEIVALVLLSEDDVESWLCGDD